MDETAMDDSEAGRQTRALKKLALELGAGRLNAAEYERRIDQILGTALPERDLAKERAWERSRAPRTSSSER